MAKIAPKENENNSIRKREYYLKYIYYVPIFIIIISYLLYINNIKIDTIIGIIAIVLALIALFITISIAQTQDKQLSKLEDIGNETKDTTIKLNTNSIMQDRIKKLFPLKDTRKKYKLFFPVDYLRKTLPLINAADSYAIHVISTHLGVDNLDLEPFARSDSNIENINLNSDAILICVDNPALKKLYMIKEIDSKDSDGSNTDLPCWFVEEKDTDGWKTYKIWINGTDAPLESPADKYCKAATKLNVGQKYSTEPPKRQDYGIFARLDKDDHKCIIIAGIHGYGTWIIASLLNDLLQGKVIEYSDYFFGDKDFIAVIYGEFDQKRLVVNSQRIGVLKKYIWVKDANEWKPVFTKF
jgi:hypothetical protein